MSAAFSCLLEEFGSTRADEVLGRLAAAHAAMGFSVQRNEQIAVWQEELCLVAGTIRELLSLCPAARSWAILLEYPIPRRDKRPDVVVLAHDVIFVVEFKFGARDFRRVDEWQALDYAMDLRDFHLGSNGRPIVPILVATAASEVTGNRRPQPPTAGPMVCPVQHATANSLAGCMAEAFAWFHDVAAEALNLATWEQAGYRPSLGIVEAAERLFAQHSVRDISHSASDNLAATADTVVRLVRQAQQEHLRMICFVTGVPGAGKTLAGLSVVHDPSLRSEDRPAGVFLSGNGPLVRIVRAALTRNAHASRGCSRRDAMREVGTFVQNVHSFLDEYAFRTKAPPPERVVIFDEAQRAWHAQKVQKEGRTRKRDVCKSEAQLMLEVMERCADWCMIVALVGGGQEIHDGEAGLAEWGRALSLSSARWRVVVSPESLSGGASLAGSKLFATAAPSHLCVVPQESLHLSISIRNVRAQKITEWVNRVLDGNPGDAGRLISDFRSSLALTRELPAARQWLKERSRAERRHGLVASSGSIRHRAYGLELSSGFRAGYPFEDWFLNGPGDVRSSYQLEVAATEFECQGLELDWVGVCWGDDLCVDPGTGQWCYRKFSGASYKTVKSPELQRYLINKYRVLLTRAREGMVIWVPPGDPTDPTRRPDLLNATAQFLMKCGVPPLASQQIDSRG